MFFLENNFPKPLWKVLKHVWEGSSELPSSTLANFAVSSKRSLSLSCLLAKLALGRTIAAMSSPTGLRIPRGKGLSQFVGVGRRFRGNLT